MHGLTIAICTRNRSTDLQRCILSISRANYAYDAQFTEVLIIDEGVTTENVLERIHKILSRAGYKLKYVANPSSPGLVHSRILAVQKADGEVILFLDDDVEIDKDYLVNLVRAYKNNPSVIGIGGINILATRGNYLSRVYNLIFCYDSGTLGKLSVSGYNGDIVRWPEQTKPFVSEYLSGCNMSFKKQALRDLEAPPWLRGYSLGEDILVSLIARRSGPLVVDPTLRVKHYRSAVSRPDLDEIAYSAVANFYHFLRLRNAAWWNYVFLGWTVLGFVLKDLFRLNRYRMLAGYTRAVKDVLGHIIRRK